MAGPIYDEDGSLIAVVETIRDITAQREAQRSLQELATTDALTDLPNRRTFDQALSTAFRRAARERRPVSLLMLDVDSFKAFNDLYGHQLGDDCLKRVARAIRGAVHRAGDVAARYGGEEFAVVLPDSDDGSARTVAERVRCAVEGLSIPHAGSAAGMVMVSVGVSTAAGSDLDAGGLLAAADAALYASKRDGRNRVTASAPEPSRRRVRRQEAAGRRRGLVRTAGRPILGRPRRPGHLPGQLSNSVQHWL